MRVAVKYLSSAKGFQKVRQSAGLLERKVTYASFSVHGLASRSAASPSCCKPSSWLSLAHCEDLRGLSQAEEERVERREERM